MSKMSFFKKLSIGCFIGLGSIFLVATSLYRAENSRLISNKMLASQNERVISSAPQPVNNLSQVNTGIQILKNGDSSIIPQLFLKQLEDSGNDAILNEYFSIYFYEVSLNPISNLYEPFTSNSPQFNIVKKQAINAQGILRLTINVANALESGNNIGNKDFDIDITGFMSVLAATSVTINQNFPFNQTNKNDLINSKELLAQAINIQNLPSGATYEFVVDKNSPGDTLNVEVKLSAYYDNNLDYVDNEFSFNIQLSNLISKPTTVISLINNLDVSTIVASNIKTDELINLIEITNQPNGANLNINYDADNGYDNKLGTIDFEVSLSPYYQDAILISDKPLEKSIKVDGFLKITESSKLKNMQGINNFKPSVVNVSNIKSYFDISTFPNDVTFSGGNFLANDKEGTLTITNLIASFGYQDDAKFTLVENYLVPEFTINNLLKQNPTIVNVIDQALDNNILASDIDQYIILNQYVSINNLPNNAVIDIQNINSDNILGQITFNLLISQYYDDNGILTNDYIKGYTINGFKKVQESTIVQKPNVDLSSILATSLNQNNISDFIDYNFFPENTYFYDYKFENASNINGTVDVSFFANKWYDERGVERPLFNDNVREKKYSITLNGFARTSQTDIDKNTNIDNSNTLASSINNQNVANLFSIINPSNDLNYPTKWSASNFQSDNLKGTLSFTITINNYFDHNGIFRSIDDLDYEPLIKNISFDNFKIVTESNPLQNNSPSNILPTDMTIAMLPNYIDISSFPDGTNITYEISNQINIKGTFDVIVIASQWYDANGNLVKVPKRFVINMVGGLKQEPTDIVQNNFDVSSMIATDVDTIDELAQLIEFVNPYGNTEPNVDWSATNFAYYNASGELYVDIKVKQYFNNDGNPIKEGSDKYQPLTKNLVIKGFRKTIKSEMQQNNVDNSNILPTTVVTNNNWKDYVDFSSFPKNIQIVNSELIPNDREGTLIVNAYIKNYYDDYGEESTNQKLFSIKLTGFNQQTKITQVSAIDNVDVDFTTIQAINLIKNNQNEFLNKYVLIEGLPPNANVTISNYFANNANGSIVVSISIDNYYDNNGNLQQNYNNSITIHGFAKVSSTIITQNNDYDFSQYTAQQFANEFLNLSATEQDKKFKEIVILSSAPDDIEFSTFSLNPINNLGEINFQFKASSIFNVNGDIESNQIMSLTINGFRTISSSILKSKDFDKDYPASDLVIDKNNFWNYFDMSAFPYDVQILDNNGISLSYNNKLGQIMVSVTLSKYYGIDGNEVNYPSIFTATISGFKQINQPSRLLFKGIPDKYKSLLPKEIVDANNPDILFNDLVDTSTFPQENLQLGIDATKFSVLAIIPNNVKGEIRFEVLASKKYAGNNNNVYNYSDKFNITISGFAKNNPSSIIIKSSLLPSQVTYEDLEFVNFDRIPNKEDVNFIFNDEEPSLTIIVNGAYYYDQDGVLRTNTNYVQTFGDSSNIKAFKKKTNVSLILGLSLGFGIPLLILIIALTGWHFYKKTHEV